MQLPKSFYRLPIRFDAARLAEEVAQFSEDEWQPHPTGHKGNSALPLVSRDGDPKNEVTNGPMRPTRHLERAPYIQQVFAAFGAPIGRSRLMRIEGNGEATAHVDTDYYWSQHVRIHVPVVTFEGVRFFCGPDETYMGPGECWLFNTWQNHNVINPDERQRIHLVIDTVGSEKFWNLVARSEAGEKTNQAVPYQLSARPAIAFESVNYPVVMSPWEASALISTVLADLRRTPHAQSNDMKRLAMITSRFVHRWRALWVCHADSAEGWPHYEAELKQFAVDLHPFEGKLILPNRIDATKALRQWVVGAALNPSLAPQAKRGSPALGVQVREVQAPPAPKPRIEHPVFIVAAPRSGSTFLFETLSQAAGAYTIGGESHGVIEGIRALHPSYRDFESNRLTAVDATPPVVAKLHEDFLKRLQDREGIRPAAGSAVCMLEKTPKNALRIPFLLAAFPDARFIYLYRDPAENIASIIEAWQSKKFITYPRLPGWKGLPWSLALVPQWRELAEKPLAEIAAHQWRSVNRQILDDLRSVPSERWCGVTYAELKENPQAVAERLSAFAGFGWDKHLSGEQPLSRHTLTPPNPEKWRKHAADIEPLLPALESTVIEARQACSPARMEVTAPIIRVEHAAADAKPEPAKNIATQGRPVGAPGAAPQLPVGPEAFRSTHSASFVELLGELGISLLVTTYQAGKLVILRKDGPVLNTHFRDFNKPMGMARNGNRLALGTNSEVFEFRNIPSATANLEEKGKADACFLPRSMHVTGDIQIHELGWAKDELWCVNTAFSCLCTLDNDHSFVPQWRPKFVTALAPEDRCHLNGLAMIDGVPRYVTALGESDVARGWKEGKRDGGILIDLSNDEIVARGLSMPHSPRWYNGKLWVLNSGDGGLGIIDPSTGRYQEVARVPGFTRGIDFCGRYAFIGLSQVRESSVFSGITIAELPLEKRMCGVSVVDIVSGKHVAYLKFEGAVQEIFSVMVTPFKYPELINDDKKVIAGSFVLPNEALASVPGGFLR